MAVTVAVTRAAFALAVLLQLLVLYAPDPGAGGDVGVPGADKAVHAAVFALAAWTGRRAGVPARWLLPALALHAGVSELVQHTLLPARAGDPLDAVADLAGLAVGAVLPTGRGRRAGHPGRPDGEAARSTRRAS